MTCPTCQLDVHTHTTDQLRRCVLAKPVVTSPNLDRCHECGQSLSPGPCKCGKTEYTESSFKPVVAPPLATIRTRCPFLFPADRNAHRAKCRLILGHKHEHHSWDGQRAPNDAPIDEIGAPGVRGGAIQSTERLSGDRIAIHLTDGRTIYTRSAPMSTPNPFEGQAPSQPAPFVTAVPAEPPVGTVLAYQRRLPGRDGGPERAYHYASIRAGDGLWYTTDREARQGVNWHALVGVLATVGDVYAATGWAPLAQFTS
jgi:hypothetical protein